MMWFSDRRSAVFGVEGFLLLCHTLRQTARLRGLRRPQGLPCAARRFVRQGCRSAVFGVESVSSSIAPSAKPPDCEDVRRLQGLLHAARRFVRRGAACCVL